MRRASSSAVVKGRRERRLDFATCGSGIPREARVVRDLLVRAGVLFPDEGDCGWAMLLLSGFASGVDETVLEIEGFCGLRAGLPAPDFGSNP